MIVLYTNSAINSSFELSLICVKLVCEGIIHLQKETGIIYTAWNTKEDIFKNVGIVLFTNDFHRITTPTKLRHFSKYVILCSTHTRINTKSHAGLELLYGQ